MKVIVIIQKGEVFNTMFVNKAKEFK